MIVENGAVRVLGLIAAVFIAFLFRVSDVWSATYEETFTPKANKAYNEDINVWVYTSEFAQRFAMPEKWVDDELKGAYAVAFRVEVESGRMRLPHKGPNVSMAIRRCILDVYLPSEAKIPWVDDQIADKWWYTPDSPTYLLPQTDEDQKWRWRPVGITHPGEKARRPLVRLNGGTLLLREYDKQLYPRMSYLSFNMGCMTPPQGQSELEFCEDRRWVGRQCYALHRIRLPTSFMQRLYDNWHRNSRRQARGGWKKVIEGQGK